MVTFEKTIEVTSPDLDELEHVNNVRYVQWIQDISKEHWEFKASEAIVAQVVWVVLNHNISYKNAAKLGDIIELRTYVEKSEGVTSTRVVEMWKKGSKTLLVSSKTLWCLLDSQTLKPKRISEEIRAIFEMKPN